MESSSPRWALRLGEGWLIYTLPTSALRVMGIGAATIVRVLHDAQNEVLALVVGVLGTCRQVIWLLERDASSVVRLRSFERFHGANLLDIGAHTQILSLLVESRCIPVQLAGTLQSSLGHAQAPFLGDSECTWRKVGVRSLCSLYTRRQGS